MKKFPLLLVFFIFINGFVVFGEKPFYVTDASEWSEKEIRKSVISGITQLGTTLLSDYQNNITRGDVAYLCTNTYRVLGNPITSYTDSHFTDVNDTYINAAYNLGIVKGISDTEFAPDEFVTRQEYTVMLGRLAKIVGYTIPEGNIKAFSDDEDISIWAKQDIYNMQSAGIINGFENGFFYPEKPVSREQAIAMAVRLFENIQGKKILLYEDTTPDILVKYGKITEEDYSKEGNITVYDVLKSIASVLNATYPDIDVSDCYANDTLSPIDDTPDSTKVMLLNLRKALVLSSDEISSLTLDADITEKEALIYLTRIITDQNCVISMDKNTSTEYIYEKAYKKGIISSPSYANSSETVKVKEFYNLLHKTIFVEYLGGGMQTNTKRIADRFI